MTPWTTFLKTSCECVCLGVGGVRLRVCVCVCRRWGAHESENDFVDDLLEDPVSVPLCECVCKREGGIRQCETWTAYEGTASYEHMHWPQLCRSGNGRLRPGLGGGDHPGLSSSPSAHSHTHTHLSTDIW